MLKYFLPQSFLHYLGEENNKQGICRDVICLPTAKSKAELPEVAYIKSPKLSPSFPWYSVDVPYHWWQDIVALCYLFLGPKLSPLSGFLIKGCLEHLWLIYLQCVAFPHLLQTPRHWDPFPWLLSREIFLACWQSFFKYCSIPQLKHGVLWDQRPAKACLIILTL